MIDIKAHPIPSGKPTQIIESRIARIHKAILILVIGVYIGLRAWNLAEYSLWGGETFILDGIYQSWSGMFSYIVRDVVHPPLFYILVKIWISIFGESLHWLKLIPFLAALIVLVPLILLGRELNLRIEEMNLALALMAVNGFLIHYAQEVRMYSLFACLSVFSLWLFVRYSKAKDRQNINLFWLFLINLLMVFTHYYGWLMIGMEFLFILLWNRAKLLPFTLSALLTFLIFSPWAYLVIRSAIQKGGLDSNVDWIAKPTIFHLKNFYSNFNGQLPFLWNMEIGLILFSTPLILWGWNIIRKKQDREEALIFWWLAPLVILPVFVLFLVSRLLDLSFWVDRYFIFVSFPYLLLIAIAIYRIKSMWVRTLMAILILAWSFLAGAIDLVTNRIAWESPQVGSRIHWERLTRQVVQAETSAASGIPIYALTTMSKHTRTGDWAIMTSIQFYLNSLNDHRFQLIYAKNVADLMPVTEHHFWVAAFVQDNNNPNGLAKLFREEGFRVGEVIQERQGDNWLILFPVWRQ